MLTAKQLKERKAGIGASEVHHVFSLKPYGCARRLWYDKTDTQPDYPLFETPAMRRGNIYEDFVAERYELETGRKVWKFEPTLHHSIPFIFSHLDRLTQLSKKEDSVPLEIKTSNVRVFRDIKENGIPDYYLLQLQQQMLCYGAEAGSFGIWEPEGAELLTVDLQSDESVQAKIVKGCSLFWNSVKSRNAPNRLKVTDNRCQQCNWRTTCQGMELLASVNVDGDVPFRAELAELIEAYQEAKERAYNAKSILDILKDEIRSEMGEQGVVDTVGARIYYKPQVSNRLDGTALKKAHPEIAVEFTRKSVGRPLRIFAK